jgi:hypothetical protein
MAVGRLWFSFGGGDTPEIGFVPSERQFGRLCFPFGGGDAPEIGFVPSERQFGRLCSHLDPGTDLKLVHSVKMASAKLNWEAEILGTGANWGFIEFSLRFAYSNRMGSFHERSQKDD